MYSWRVPPDIELSGNEETFTVTVTYDTGPLCGTVVDSREIVVYRIPGG